jgi:hypothetical protein
MNTASGLGNFGVLGANIAAPIYMTVDAAQQSAKADEARRQAQADAERAYKEMQEDREKGDKLNKEMSDAAKAQEDMYLAALGVFNQNQNRQDGTLTIDDRPITQQEADILNVLGTIAAPPIEPPPPPTSIPNTYVPLAPAPPAPPAVVPVQTTVAPTVLPPPPPPPPPPSSGPTVRGVRGRGRSCRGGKKSSVEGLLAHTVEGITKMNPSYPTHADLTQGIQPQIYSPQIYRDGPFIRKRKITRQPFDYRGGMTHADHEQDILQLLRAYK